MGSSPTTRRRYGYIAQLAEHRTLNPQVEGSIPSIPIQAPIDSVLFFALSEMNGSHWDISGTACAMHMPLRQQCIGAAAESDGRYPDNGEFPCFASFNRYKCPASGRMEIQLICQRIQLFAEKRHIMHFYAF